MKVYQSKLVEGPALVTDAFVLLRNHTVDRNGITSPFSPLEYANVFIYFK